MSKKRTVLVIIAHCDDEVLGAGGAIAKHVALGDDVFVAHATISARNLRTGGYNFEDSEERTRHSIEAAKILGFNWCARGTFKQVCLDQEPNLNLTWWVEDFVRQLKPQVIYTHHWGDLNVDHRAISNAVLTACRPKPGCTVEEIHTFEILSSTEWSFDSTPSFKPNFYVDITEFIGKKIDAMNCYSVETGSFPHPRSQEVIKSKAMVRGSEVGVNFAEAFQTVWRLF